MIKWREFVAACEAGRLARGQREAQAAPPETDVRVVTGEPPPVIQAARPAPPVAKATKKREKPSDTQSSLF